MTLNLRSAIVYSLVALFVLINGILFLKGVYVFLLAPVALLLIYTALFHFESMFLFVVFCAPLSLNLEDLVGNGGLYLPTEPLLFGMTLIIFLKSILKGVVPFKVFLHPITLILGLQVFWILITSFTSEIPLVSFKFLLSRLWFLIPMILFGAMFFEKEKNYRNFISAFLASLAVVVGYTLINHASNGFSEESGHWVMSPFFKDHTSYGAVLALLFPLTIALYIINKGNILPRFLALCLIGLIGGGIIFSYTRAAWVTVFGAFLLYLIIVFRIKFYYLLVPALIAAVFVYMKIDKITMEMERNKVEHTTEDLQERLQSATNITTDASNLERLNRWNSAMEMYRRRSLFGWGPGTYAFVYAPFQADDDLTIISTNFGDGGNAHSEYLGPLSEQGFPGMILMIVLVVAIFYYGFVTYSRMEPSHSKTLLLYSLLGLSTYFVHGILNNYLDIDKAAIPVWGMTAFVIAMNLKYPGSSRQNRILSKMTP
ncbi:MAG: O-antigen ligase family protein [Crocinitomicaceae bacterium]